MRNARFVGALAVCTLVFGATEGRADEESANVGRGFQPERSFELGEIDHMNGFNGNLVVTVPIGQVYTVSPQLSYQFQLTWNSNIWDGDEDVNTDPPTSQAYLSRSSNAGAGWTFGLGRLIQARDDASGNRSDDVFYLAPDGRRISFQFTLKPTDADDLGDTTLHQNVLYSRDGSYLRARRGACDASPNDWRCDWQIDFPSGLVHSFRRSDGALTSITDRFGNSVSITYTSNSWTVTDGIRTHTVSLSLKSYDDSPQRYMVSAVHLAAFGGGSADYTFSYLATTLPRATPCDQIHQSANPPAQLLSGVAGPQGWGLSMPEYQLDSTGGTKLAGTLQKLVLPTGGALEWDYQMYNFAGGQDSKPFLTGSAGVKARRTVNSSGSVEGIWSYVVELPGAGHNCDSNPPSKTLKRTTISPLGDKTVKYFTAWPCGSDPNYGEYGLPYDKTQTDAASGAYLSEEIWDCTFNPADPPNPTGCGSNPKRKIYLKYERNDYLPPSGPQSLGEAMNQRVAYQKVLSDDEDVVGGTPKFKETTWSSFDDFGHYRQELLGGNFDAGNSHTTFTNFTPLASLLPSPTWILGLYDRIDQTEGGDTSRREFVFETLGEPLGSPPKGYLRCVRTVRTSPTVPVPRTGNDLLTRFTVNAAGFLTQERFYGGDRQSILLTGACEDGTSPEYTIDHTYQFGSRATSKYSTLSWKSLDLTNDANTGLASSRRDTAGIPTSLVYDELGRLTEFKPLGSGSFGPESWTSIQYHFGTQQSGVFTSVTSNRCSSTAPTSCIGTNRLTTEHIDFDDFGRVWQEGRRLPDGTSNLRRTLYDAAGNRAQVSTWKPSASGTFIDTVYSGYDPYGRPGTITAPDGKVTTMTRKGDRTVETKQTIATSITGTEEDVWRKETYDRQGRLFRVEELSNPGNPVTYDTKTDYSYDEAGRLSKVCQNASGATCGQTRVFTYDNRGFLLAETHPEKGASGNGDVLYGCYDSRGHAGQQQDGANSRISAFTFDLAGRLTFMRSRTAAQSGVCSDTSGTVWKQFAYDNATGAGAGKLYQAIRRNDLPAPWSANYQITETYEYGEQMGRTSKRTTALAVNSVAKETWGLTIGYHDLGAVDSLSYPTCTGTGCTPDSATPLSLSYTYTDGLLTAIPNWTNGGVARPIDYHANLLVSSIQHGNGTIETIVNDPNRLQRPKSTTATALDDNFAAVNAYASGDFVFDGGGNISAMGSDHFKYDRLSRLLDSHLDSSAPGRTQSYTFDVYGNLATKTTDGGTAITFPVSAASNRLTTGSSYDGAGNQTGYNGTTYSFDLMNTMTAVCTSGAIATCPASSEFWGNVYTADDERVVAYERDSFSSSSDLRENWTVRDLQNRILRRDEWLPGTGTINGSDTSTTCPGSIAIYCQSFESGNYLGWSQIATGGGGTTTDYVWRGDKLFGVQSTSGTIQHFVLDHLGTIRAATDDLNVVAARHAYFPFGEEASSTSQDAEPMKFAGRERDLHSTPGDPADDLDYIHARFDSPLTGRFLSVDSVLGNRRRPQSWNRYTLTLGNPMTLIDANGLESQLVVGGPTENNAFGHIAPAVDGKVYSYGTKWVDPKGDWGVSLDKYLEAQSGNRETTIVTLETTDQQEADLKESLEASNPYEEGEYSELNHSCVTETENYLENAGILTNEPGPVVVDRGGNELQAGSASPRTPSALVKQAAQQGRVRGAQSAGGKKVSKLRSWYGTAKGLFRRLIR